MVRRVARVLACLAALGAVAPAPTRADDEPDRAIGRAMGKGSFPWYDAPRDAVRPLRVPAARDDARAASSTPAASAPSAGGWGLGNLVATAGFALALVALIGLLVWFWRMYEPSAEADADPPSKARAGPGRVEELPVGLRQGYDPSDPWSEAIRHRDRGDLAGAIVCLFAHQLLTLGRLGLVRLAPGRTGRQLLRSVTDPEFRGLVAPTLGLFEAAYYGRHAPSPGDFAAAWAVAEAFERRVAAGAAP